MDLTKVEKIYDKAELLQEGIIFLIHLIARAILLMKKLKIEETKATKHSTFKTYLIKISFFDFQLFR